MGHIFPVAVLPMQRVEIQELTGHRETSQVTWYQFPKQLSPAIQPILNRFGYADRLDDYPNVESFLRGVETVMRSQESRCPWAVIILPDEYPVMGHLLSFRKHPNDFLASSFSIMNPLVQPFDVSDGCAPTLSVLWIFTKDALKVVAKGLPSLFGRMWGELCDCDEQSVWAYIADPFNEHCVDEVRGTDEQLFFRYALNKGAPRT